MITEIKIENISSYKGPVIIEELKKLNFFFGNNGSGKSTIAKFLYNINSNKSTNDELRFEDCSQLGFNGENNEVLVFDDEFVKRNFIKEDFLKGVFSLDEENDEIERKIKEKQLKVEKIENYISKDLNDKNESYEVQLEELYKGKKTGILDICFQKRDVFNQSLPLIRLKYKGSKPNHFSQVEKVLKDEENKNYKFKDLKKEYELFYEQNLTKVHNSFKSSSYLKIRRLEEKINYALKQIFTGNKDIDIAEMIDRLNLQKWVEEGLEKIDRSGKKEKCPFCQEFTITQELIKKFDEYFDESYKKKKKYIEGLLTRYESLSEQIITNLNAIKTEFNPDSQLSDLVLELSSHFDSQKDIIQSKLDRTNETFAIDSVFEFKPKLSNLIDAVKTNNEMFDSLEDKKENLDSKIWNYISFNSKDDIEFYYSHKNEIEFKKAAINRFKTYLLEKLRNLRLEIEGLRDNTINTSKAKENINKILKGAGFKGFEIGEMPKKSEKEIPKYYLKRNDSESNDVFNTLSEGEKNFIAFLYFNEICKGTLEKDNKEKKKIVVIDDPVSSLDSQALFIVTTIIRDLAKKKGRSANDKKEFYNPHIEQIFVLTHNIYFHKEVTFAMGNKLCQEISYYQIQKISDKTNIEKTAKNEIDNDYNLLWKGLQNLKTERNPANNVVVGNLMRRILQSYLNFTRNTPKEWTLIEELEQNDPKRIIFSCLISQINDDSHHYNPNDDFYYQRMTHTDIEDLYEVFELMFKDIGGIEHFNIMQQYSEN
ncbi:AAA family ATPase [Salinimicrobium tongyeongense]|uniref:AAA family ATPase n=1 Tax=Salinimicrobium tongyeongense TaxID=2809707 RepID=A0ABY6NPR1_9FLAO|nr:AAA family ATPase [Salinimicrobium tongyeongense]UZH54869.1 AAA family ATPase [Salinimicrobium tongyeongense]